ncbi:hypothetical protein [Synechococcus sp. CCY 9618]|uniref:hypothetical protein n=1 Tax=Synechococcus sp. CCY 9618 TaxID=2815602 RepID=UPI001C229951|nr:hypothetical protein [Synechococcus sp. CCY 9618]
MDSLDTFVHPQAWATALAMVDLSIAWMIATAALAGLIRERRRRADAAPATSSPSDARRPRFA